MMKRSIAVVGIVVLLGAGSIGQADAAEGAPADRYAGDFLTRSTLTGDWGGLRDDALEKGVKIDANLTQVGQGVVSGGKDSGWEYGGRANVTTNLDTQKLGLWPGGFLTAEFESNWSEGVNASTGALSPVNTNQLFPLPSGDNVALPQLSFAQFVSPYAGILVGKLDTVALGDANEFAHGKGDTQFFNLSLNINPTLLVIPYSTLGAGLILLPTKDPDAAIATFSVLSARGKPSTSGFDNLNSDSLIFNAEGRVRTGFFGRTGHQLVGGLYSNAQYTSVDQRLGAVIDNRALTKKRDTWAAYYNFDQFLYETDKSAGRGFGVFGRFGASAGTPNPIQYFISIGLGSKGVFASRPFDAMGIGFYYMDINSPSLEGPFQTRTILGEESGFEAYYNLAITPWMQLTPDIQVIGPSQRQRFVSPGKREFIDTAVILGSRLRLIF